MTDNNFGNANAATRASSSARPDAEGRRAAREDHAWLEKQCREDLLDTDLPTDMRVVAANMLFALAEKQDPGERTVEALAKALRDKTAAIRAAAAEIFAHAPDVRTARCASRLYSDDLLSALCACLGDKDKRVRKLARAALIKVGQCEKPSSVIVGLLEELRRTTDAKSCFLHVAHPMYDGHFDLVGSAGQVDYPRLQNGIVFPPASLTQESCTQAQMFREHAAKEPSMRSRPGDPKLAPVVEKLAADNPLYRDFIEREGIVSCVRLVEHTPAGQVRAVLFVNFDRRRKFSHDHELENQIVSAFERMVSLLDGCEREIKEEPFSLGARLPASFDPVVRSPAMFAAREVLQIGLEHLVENILFRFGFETKGFLASIFIYDPHNHTLKPRVTYGEDDQDRHPKSINITSGRGFLSYAALRRIALVVDDVHADKYSSIYEVFRFETRSEMVVPLLDGSELVGVLNLESKEIGAFSDRLILPVSWTANQIASRYRRCISEALASRLERLYRARHPRHEGPLQLIVNAAAEDLGVRRLDIWAYDARTDKFVSCAASYRNFEEDIPPRKNGWTRFVVKHACPVFLHIDRDGSAKGHRWINWQWSPIKSEDKAPPSVHNEARRLRIECEMAVPLMDRGACVGVLWLKFDDQHAELPTTEWMNKYTDYGEETGWLVDTAVAGWA